MFDFALLRKPMVFYTYDYAEYLSTRGTYFDLMEVGPGPFVTTTAELVEALGRPTPTGPVCHGVRGVPGRLLRLRTARHRGARSRVFSAMARTVVSKPPVLILANHIDGLGGVERVANGLAAGLAGRGYDVALRGIRPPPSPGRT